MRNFITCANENAENQLPFTLKQDYLSLKCRTEREVLTTRSCWMWCCFISQFALKSSNFWKHESCSCSFFQKNQVKCSYLVCSNVPMFSGALRQNPWRMSCRSTMLKQHSSIKICMDRNQNHSKVARKKGQVKILKQFDQFVGRACPARLKFESRDSSLRRSLSCMHFSRFKKTQKVYSHMLKKRRDICECASIVSVQRWVQCDKGRWLETVGSPRTIWVPSLSTQLLEPFQHAKPAGPWIWKAVESAKALEHSAWQNQKGVSFSIHFKQHFAHLTAKTASCTLSSRRQDASVSLLQL